MVLEDKYKEWSDIYWTKFVKAGDPRVAGNNIPLESLDAASRHGEVGDGTINIAEMMQFIHVLHRLGEKAPVSMSDALWTIERLQQAAYHYYQDKFPEFQIPEYWFLLRDDISPRDADYMSGMNLGSVKSCYGMLTTGAYDDPCWGSFESQDQIWNLNPMLFAVSQDKAYSETDSVMANNIGYGLNNYIASNGYTVYDPYLSYIKHRITYCPDFDKEVYERLEEREQAFKPNIKVKRGANNWYYAGGTQACRDAFADNEKSYEHTFRTFFYRGTIFFLDCIWEPLLKIFGEEFKHNSYNCYAATSGIWYGPNFEKKTAKRLNKSLENGDPYNPNTSFLVSKPEDVDWNLVYKWLDNYPAPDNTKMEYWTPVQFLYIYGYYKLSCS